MLSIKNQYFSMDKSSFMMEQYKCGSARQAMFTDFKINNSFTLENSFFAKYTQQQIERMKEQGYKESPVLLDSMLDQPMTPSMMYDQLIGCHHFSAKNHYQLGVDLCHTLHKVFIAEPNLHEVIPSLSPTKQERRPKRMHSFSSSSSCDSESKSISPVKRVEKPDDKIVQEVIENHNEMKNVLKTYIKKLHGK